MRKELDYLRAPGTEVSILIGRDENLEDKLLFKKRSERVTLEGRFKETFHL